jgi:hypothetical protein
MLTIAGGIVLAVLLLSTARYWAPILAIVVFVLTVYLLGAAVVLGLLYWLSRLG